MFVSKIYCELAYFNVNGLSVFRMTICMGRPKKCYFFSQIGFFCCLVLFVCLFCVFYQFVRFIFVLHWASFFPLLFCFVLGLSITPLKIYDTIYWVKEWKNEWLGEWFNGRMNGWMNEWIDRTQCILNTGCRRLDDMYRCIFRRIRRIRRYKTFHFGSIVVEKDTILYLRSSFKVV